LSKEKINVIIIKNNFLGVKMIYILEKLKEKITFFLKITKKYKFITKLMIIGIIFFSIVFCIKRIVYNVTDSMTKGIYVKKIISDYKKGDLVIFLMDKKYLKYVESSLSKNKGKKLYLLKRIVAVEGDTIETRSDGAVLINGEKKGKIFKIKGLTDKIENTRYILKKDEYYVMGDTETSFDSRYLGILRKKDFKSEVKLLIEEKTLEKLMDRIEGRTNK
jgi:signal peptidase I